MPEQDGEHIAHQQMYFGYHTFGFDYLPPPPPTPQ